LAQHLGAAHSSKSSTLWWDQAVCYILLLLVFFPGVYGISRLTSGHKSLAAMPMILAAGLELTISNNPFGKGPSRSQLTYTGMSIVATRKANQTEDGASSTPFWDGKTQPQ
jgi:hypothetical protein